MRCWRFAVFCVCVCVYLQRQRIRQRCMNKISPPLIWCSHRQNSRVWVCECRKRKNVVMAIIRLVLLLKYTGILKLLSSLSSGECRFCLTATLPFSASCQRFRCCRNTHTHTHGVRSVGTHACNRHHHHHRHLCNHYFETDSCRIVIVSENESQTKIRTSV